MRSRLVAVLVAALTVTGLVVIDPAQGVAPTGTPNHLIADFGTDPSYTPRNPTLRWDRLNGASAYRVQIAKDSSFSGIVYDQQTVGHQVTPDQTLPLGDLYWRVAGTDGGSGTGPFSMPALFAESWSQAPHLLSPVDYDPSNPDTVLGYPDNPAVFSWTALDGAKSYTLQIDDSSDFIGAQQFTTSNNSYTLLEPQTINQQFFWRVQASSGANGVVSPWSTVRSYMYSWLSTPTLGTPANTNDPSITDVEFSWDAVPGAKNYQLQVSPNGDWTNNVIINSTLTATHYSPPIPLQNGSYFWRVRALDAATQQHNGTWSDTWTFTREWTTRPTILTPAWDPSTPDVIPHVAGALDLSWTPVPHAAYYEVQFSIDPNFSTSVNCFTNHTEWTPYSRIYPTPSTDVGEPGGCLAPNPNVPIWSAGTTYYWRVRGVDPNGGLTPPNHPVGINGLWSDYGSAGAARFVRDPLAPQTTSPNEGDTVSVPTLSWNPVEGAEKYKVTLKTKTGAAVTGFPLTTYATTVTPTVALKTTDAPFSWYVQSVDGTGFTSAVPAPVHFSVTPPSAGSTLALDAPQDGYSSRLMPAMTWEPLTGATYYVVHYSFNGFEQTPLATKLAYPAFAASGVPLGSGTYLWWVEAQDASGVTLATSSAREFVITPPDVLGKDDYLTPNRCDPQGTCVAAADTPTLSWKPIPNAGFYRVTIANDRHFTNVVREYTTAYTMLTPRESLLDNQAGQAYYWFVRPCVDATMLRCGPGSDDDNVNVNAGAFRKRSMPIVLEQPTSQSSVANQVTFRWQDYLLSESGSGAQQEAAQYRIQVSTAADFSGTPIDTQVVDATSYTPSATTYPEGPLYWRVQAIDASGNDLTWSDDDGLTTNGWLVTKRSPAPVLTYPADGASETGVPYLTWQPQNYAASYAVEVYRNGDLNASPSNLATSTSTKFAAWSPITGLAQGDYVWRVRRVDSGGKVGPWSTMRTFHLAQDAPTLTSPADNAVATSSDLVFTWTPVAGAAQYRWQLSSNAGFSPVTASQNTVNSAWSPLGSLADGAYYWRVQVLDGAGNVLATSGSRALRKDGTAPTVKTLSPTSALGLTNPLTATFSEAVTNVSPSSFRVVSAGSTSPVAGRVTSGTVGGVPTAMWTPMYSLVPGQTYAVLLTSAVTDLAGNPVVARTWTVRTSTTVENTSPAFVEHWDRDTASGAAGGSYDASKSAASAATFTFAGNQVSVLGTRAKTGGYAAVYLDGKLQSSAVSFYSANTRYRQAVWTKSGLATGTHTLVVKVLGTKPSVATDRWVYLDGFQVGSVLTDQSSAPVHETFTRVSSANASGGSYDSATHVTNGDTSSRPSYSATFRGTGVSIYGVRSASSGKAAVYIDNALRATVDLHSTTTSYRSSLYSVSGLPDRIHTVRIDVVGTPTGTASAVGVDYLMAR